MPPVSVTAGKVTAFTALETQLLGSNSGILNSILLFIITHGMLVYVHIETILISRLIYWSCFTVFFFHVHVWIFIIPYALSNYLLKKGVHFSSNDYSNISSIWCRTNCHGVISVCLMDTGYEMLYFRGYITFFIKQKQWLSWLISFISSWVMDQLIYFKVRGQRE